MSRVTLRPKAPTAIPIEAECISPDRFAGLTAAEIATLPVWHGNQQCPLGEFFAVGGDGGDEIVIAGDVPHVKWLGRGMTHGRIEVQGACGMHAGSGMRGGELLVRGDAGHCLGAEMAGGLIRVAGSAGHQLGAGYPGSRTGMTGGLILVRGNAGNEAGSRLGRGVIAVLGDLGDLAGLGMHAGTILCGGQMGVRAGAWMRRGSVVCWGGADPLPTFIYAATYSPPWLPLYLRTLGGLGVPVPEAWATGAYRIYSGDAVVGGRGEVLLWAAG